jgi:hypothetical protein
MRSKSGPSSNGPQKFPSAKGNMYQPIEPDGTSMNCVSTINDDGWKE